MAELVDALDSKSSGLRVVGVRFPPSAFSTRWNDAGLQDAADTSLVRTLVLPRARHPSPPLPAPPQRAETAAAFSWRDQAREPRGRRLVNRGRACRLRRPRHRVLPAPPQRAERQRFSPVAIRLESFASRSRTRRVSWPERPIAVSEQALRARRGSRRPRSDRDTRCRPGCRRESSVRRRRRRRR